GDQIGIEEIVLDRPWLNLVVDTTGAANWDIVPEGEPTGETDDSGLEMKLEQIEIIDGRFVYNDKEMDMLLELAGLNFDISGEMYGTATQLLAEGGSDRFSLAYEGTSFISNVSL